MARWTQSPEEYAHVRSIIVDGPLFGSVDVTMRDGNRLSGLLRGSRSANDVGENMKAGRGPIVTHISGEITLEVEGEILTLDALDILTVQQVRT